MGSPLFATRRVLWLPLDLPWRAPVAEDGHCCTTMLHSLEMHCDQHEDPFECPDVALVYHDIFGEYGIPVRDGGPGYLLISHCPWCGAHLPESARDAWFDATGAAGLANVPLERMPDIFRTSAFRRSLRA